MAGNSYFNFKQFTINQSQCAMKVCTDACVLGSWFPIFGSGRILDIGAGTGLLSLMAAQRNPSAVIDAVELDGAAFEQAQDNIRNSPFAERIQVFHTAIQDFSPGYQYDCIVTNPPFFQSDLLSPNGRKNQAHHAVTLSFEDLLSAMHRFLVQNGSFHILLPTDEAAVFQAKSEALGWSLTRKLILHHHSHKKPFRVVMTFFRSHSADNQVDVKVLNIYQEDGKTYDSEFKDLLKDFYMIF